jgi:ABC-type nickel/cobalt efflux system permease component RcnA
MTVIVSKFLEYGILGLIALLAIWFAWRKDRDNKTLNEEKDELHKEHAVQLGTITSDHKAEMMALEERYITKAETWMQQHYELSRAQNEVLTSMERRYGR